MKTSKSILGSLTIAALAFVAGAITAASRGWGQAVAIVNVVNTSDRALATFAVHFDTCGFRGSVEGGTLAPGASNQVRYLVCGESGQTVRAEFTDGKVVTSEEAYVESGYRVTENVSRDAITR